MVSSFLPMISTLSSTGILFNLGRMVLNLHSVAGQLKVNSFRHFNKKAHHPSCFYPKLPRWNGDTQKAYTKSGKSTLTPIQNCGAATFLLWESSPLITIEKVTPKTPKPAITKTSDTPRGSSSVPPSMVPTRTAVFMTALNAAKVRVRNSGGVYS
jgi:hypothetical protein